MREITGILIVVLLAVSACQDGAYSPPEPQTRAAAIPLDAVMAVDSTHDLVIAACVDRVKLVDFVAPSVVTAVFVGSGRIDAAFYLPDALAAAAIPDCEPAEFTVENARVEGDGFELVETENPAAFHVRATDAGTAVFRATVHVDGEKVDVESTFDAREVDRVEMQPICRDDEQYEVDERLVIAGTFAEFDLEYTASGAEVAGYDFSPVVQDTVREGSDYGAYWTFAITEEPGPATVTSRYDDDLQLELEVIAPDAFDTFEVAADVHSRWFVGQEMPLRMRLLHEGKLPCGYVDGLRTRVETPRICAIVVADDPRAESIETSTRGTNQIIALSPGICRVWVEYPPTGHEVAIDQEVYAGFAPEETELPDIRGVYESLGIAFDSGEYFFPIAKPDVSSSSDYEVVYSTGGGSPWDREAMPGHVADVDAADGHVFFAAGGGFVVEYDGDRWTRHELGNGAVRARALLANSSTDVWVATGWYASANRPAELHHFDGNGWQKIAAPESRDIADIWSPPGGPLYLAADTLYRRDPDGSWTDLFAEQPEFLSDGWSVGTVAGTASDDIWLAGSDNGLLHFDGDRWEPIPIAETGGVGPPFEWIWRSISGETFVLSRGNLQHFDGDRVAVVAPADDLFATDDTIHLRQRDRIRRLTLP